MPLRRLLPTLLALSSLGCAAPLTCPAKGGAPWTEASSAHFVLRTDADPPEVHAMLVQFEKLWEVLAYVTRRPPVNQPKIDIVRFRRHVDMFEITGHKPGHGGYFSSRLDSDLVDSQPTLVYQGDDLADEDRETFLHELAHGFLHERFAAIPTWLNEGMAQYFETLRLEESRVVLGETGGLDFSDRTHWWGSWRGNALTMQIPAFKAPTVWALVTADWSTFHTAGASADPTNEDRDRETTNYAAAWKLVHYFLDGPDAGDRARFTAFLTAVEHGKRARDVFLETFGADLPRLETSFHAYLTHAQASRRIAEYRAEPTATPPALRVMSDAEVHLLWARLLPWDKRSADQVRRELDEAMASDPGSPEVRYRRGLFFLEEKQLDQAARELDAALAARPDEPRYLAARLAWYEEVGKGAPEDLVDHLVHAASSAAQLRAAADQLAQRGRTEEGFGLINRALAMDPLCWRCQHTKAWMLARIGKLDEALTAVDREIELLPERARVEAIVAFRRKIELARSAAKPAQGSAPP